MSLWEQTNGATGKQYSGGSNNQLVRDIFGGNRLDVCKKVSGLLHCLGVIGCNGFEGIDVPFVAVVVAIVAAVFSEAVCEAATSSLTALFDSMLWLVQKVFCTRYMDAEGSSRGG